MSAALDNVEDIYPLSPIQEGMLYHAIEAPKSDVFVSQVIVDINSPIDSERLASAWRLVVGRHTALRTVFVWDGVDRPLQVVRKRIETSMSEVSLSTNEQASFDAWLRQDRNLGFDLDQAPPWRLTLVTSLRGRARLVWTCHHLLADGWSTQIVFDELSAAYNGAGNLSTPPAAQLRDYIAWHQQRDRDDDESFWRLQTAGFEGGLALSTPGHRPTKADNGYAKLTHYLDIASTDHLRAFAARSGVTVNAVVCAAWSLFLSRWQMSRDVVFGVTMSARPADIKGVEQIVGPLIATLPMRVDVDAGLTAAAFTQRIQKLQAEVRERDHVALTDIKKWSELPKGDALFESIFVFENFPTRDLDRGAESRFSAPVFNEHSNYPLAVLVVPGESLALSFVFDRTRFGEDGINEVATAFVALIENLVSNGDQPLGSIPTMRYSRLRDVRVDTEGASGSATASTALDLFGRAVAKTPDAPAVACDERRLSYRELDEAAERIARRLSKSGVVRGDIVGLCIERSVEMIIGLLGILKCGAAYAPLDPSYPEAYVKDILRGASIKHVVVSNSTAEKFTGILVVNVEEVDRSDVMDFELRRPLPEDLAYIIHTSGSSGAPKGVMISHANLVHSTLARQDYYGSAPKAFLLLSSIAFDSSVAGIYWSLCTGGELVLPRSGAEQETDEILSLARKCEVSHLLCLPSLYSMILQNGAAQKMLATLKVAIVAGEACEVDLPALHRSTLPNAELHNEYGPTEATVWCTSARLDDRPVNVETLDSVSIGAPIRDVNVCIRDLHGHETPLGLAGEIMVSGPTLAAGYLGRSELTAEKFVRLSTSTQTEVRYYKTGDLGFIRADGEIGFLGRIDNQLKIRGRRIEAEHIAATLRRRDDVSDAVVTVVQVGRSGVRRLAAYVVPKNGGDPDAPMLKAFVGAHLPDYMIPDIVIVLNSLPHLPNGKIDMRKLPTPDFQNEKLYEPPKPGAEAVLAEIWSNLLGVERIGRHDDFFELGGDSLLAMRLVARIRKRFEKSMPVARLADASTIVGIAQLIEADAAPRRWRALVPLRAKGEAGAIACVCAPFSSAIFYKPIADRLTDRRPIVAFEPVGQEGDAPPLSSIEEMAELYVAELLEAYPRGPYALMGYCIGATVCHEMAHRLRSAGHEVEILIAVGAALPFRDTAVANLTRKVKQALAAGGVGVLFERTAKFIGVRAARKALAAGNNDTKQQQAWGEAAALAFRRAFENYSLRTGETPILSIMASTSASIIGQEAHLAWRAFTNDFQARTVTGVQETLMSPPEVDDVARFVNHALAQRSKLTNDIKTAVLANTA